MCEGGRGRGGNHLGVNTAPLLCCERAGKASKRMQAAKLADANKMEQQRLKHIAKKKEIDHLRKVKEDVCKQYEDDKRCKNLEAAAVLPAQPPEKESMEVNKPSLGINSLLTKMMQGTNNKGEGENIDPKTRSPGRKSKRMTTLPSSPLWRHYPHRRRACKTSIRGCNKMLLCITVKLVHKIMRFFYSHCFAF
jgi:hypothetical protein